MITLDPTKEWVVVAKFKGVYKLYGEYDNHLQVIEALKGKKALPKQADPFMTYTGLAIKMGGTGEFRSGGTESIDISAKELRALAKQYPDLFDLEQTQNDSPTVGFFLENAGDEDILMSYVVSDSRNDKRVSIEGIITTSKKVADIFRQNRPDEDSKEGKAFRLWWD